MSDDRSTNIAETVFRDLRKQILSGVFKAGERLPGERELAQKYSTNRNTLREAVRKLEQSRLVTVRHGQGVTVSDFRRTGTLELLTPFLESASDGTELSQIIADILPGRVLLLEHATRLAVRRADRADIQRLRDIAELLGPAFERGDPVVLARGFQRWMEALVDAGHSIAVRWIANPLLEAYRDLVERLPSLWVVEPSFPEHLRDVIESLEAGDEERAARTTRTYYDRVDRLLTNVLASTLSHSPIPPPSSPVGSSSPIAAPPLPTDSLDHDA